MVIESYNVQRSKSARVHVYYNWKYHLSTRVVHEQDIDDRGTRDSHLNHSHIIYPCIRHCNTARAHKNGQQE